MKRLMVYLSISVFLFCLLQCENDVQTIFYALENEETIGTTGIPRDVTVTNVIRTDNYWYALSGKIYRSDINETKDPLEWTVTNNEFTDNSQAICLALAVFDETIFGSFYNPDNSTFGLYSSIDATSDAPVELSWTAVAAPGVTDEQTIRLDVLESSIEMVVCTMTDTASYSLFYTTNGSDFNTSNLTELESPVIGVTVAFSMYWVVTKEKVYSGVDLDNMSEYDGPTTSGSWSAVLFSDANALLLLTGDEGIVYSFDGGTWETAIEVEVSEKTVPLTTLSALSDGVLAGSVGYGMFILSGLDGSSTVDANRLYDGVTTEFVQGIILNISIYNDTSPYMVFVCTSHSGLWRSFYSATETEWDEWSW